MLHVRHRLLRRVHIQQEDTVAVQGRFRPVDSEGMVCRYRGRAISPERREWIDSLKIAQKTIGTAVSPWIAGMTDAPARGDDLGSAFGMEFAFRLSVWEGPRLAARLPRRMHLEFHRPL